MSTGRDDRDPEAHTFTIRPEKPREANGRGHILDVTAPTYGDDHWVSTTRHNFSLAELTGLRDKISAYLEEHGS